MFRSLGLLLNEKKCVVVGVGAHGVRWFGPQRRSGAVRCWYPGFSTHRGNFQWRTCSMGSQSSPAVYVAMVNDCLSRYGICAGDRKDPAKRGPEADELQRIFSSKTEEYGDCRVYSTLQFLIMSLISRHTVS